MGRRFIAYVRGILGRTRAAAEADEELAFHITRETEANIARGMGPAEARRVALADLGGSTHASEAVRDVRMTWLDAAARDLRMAWRGVRSRGWRAALIVGLLGLTLAANATTFAVVDSLVFNPHPYPAADRMVALQQKAAPGQGLGRTQNAALYEEWRTRRDLFSAVGGYLTKTVFVTRFGATEKVPTADITVDLFDVLGVRPRWGRGFADADLTESNGYAAILSESLARELFGAPDRAPGQRVDATGGPLLVVGVMAADFGFPRVGIRLWRAMDLAGPLTLNFGGVSLIARVAPGVALDDLPARLAGPSTAVGEALGLRGYTVQAKPYFQPVPHDARRTMLLVLLGAALALLLASCANVASLELAHAVARGRINALLLALGAPRSAIVRTVLLEGALFIGGALAVGWGLTLAGLHVIVSWLPESLTLGGQNPIRFDPRALSFMAAAAAGAWLIASMVPTVAAARSRPAAALTIGARSTALRRTTVWLRQLLTLAEVALAVGLVVIGALYARGYVALTRIEKGFNSSGLAEVSASVPAYYFATALDRAAFDDRLLATLRGTPGVVAATAAVAPPNVGDSPMRSTLEIDGVPGPEPILLGRNWIDPSYFATIGLPLRAGRYLNADDPANQVVIGESLARRFWKDGDAVGHTLRGMERGFFADVMTVVGVVGDVRTEPTRMPGTADARYFVYSMRQRTPPGGGLAGARSPQVDNGGFYGFVDVTVRMDSPSRAAAVLAAARRDNPRLAFAMTFVDDSYADQNADARLATQVVNAFSTLSFFVSMAGLYGVMAFLVASRTREIGIRMALGADPRRVRRLVLRSAVGLVLVGGIAGALGAALVARSIQSQLFGVSALDWRVYATVVVATIATALVATWQPAWQAARVDPAVTLRAE